MNLRHRAHWQVAAWLVLEWNGFAGERGYTLAGHGASSGKATLYLMEPQRHPPEIDSGREAIGREWWFELMLVLILVADFSLLLCGSGHVLLFLRVSTSSLYSTGVVGSQQTIKMPARQRRWFIIARQV